MVTNPFRSIFQLSPKCPRFFFNVGFNLVEEKHSMCFSPAGLQNSGILTESEKLTLKINLIIYWRLMITIIGQLL